MTGRLQDRIALICSAQHRCEHRRVFSRRAHGSSSSIAIRSAGRPAGQTTAERLSAKVEAIFVQCNVSQADQVTALVTRAVEHDGRVDILH